MTEKLKKGIALALVFGAAAYIPAGYDIQNPQYGTSLGYYTSKPFFGTLNLGRALHSKIINEAYDVNANGNYKFYIAQHNPQFKKELTDLVVVFAKRQNCENTDVDDFFRNNPQFADWIPDDVDAGIALMKLEPEKDYFSDPSISFKCS